MDVSDASPLRCVFPRMMLPPQRRRYNSTLAWCGLVLSLAVILWGASYKMQQYPQQGLAFRVMSPAKLLTENERPPRRGSLRAVVPAASTARQTSHTPVWVFTDRASTPVARSRALFVPDASGLPILRAELSYFSFRPPPSPLYS